MFKVGDWVVLDSEISDDDALELIHDYSTSRDAMKIALSREPFEIQKISPSRDGIMANKGNYIPRKILVLANRILFEGVEL